MASPLASMLAQSSASGTNPTPYHATVAPTDVEKAYSDYNNAMMQAYQAQLAQQNSMWGGLASLGSAGIMSLPKLMGSAGAAGAASAASSPIAALTAELGPAAIL